jgi:hypothetical protein
MQDIGVPAPATTHVRIDQVQRSLHASCIFAVNSLHIQCTFIACPLVYIHCVFTVYLLYI